MPRARFRTLFAAATAMAVIAAGAYFARTPHSHPAAEDSAYVNPKVCADCHPQIAQTYASTGMGRSLYRPPANPPAGAFYHKTTDMHYAMVARGGKYYQRRWQGAESNGEELQVDYILGSGNHAVTYLHRTPRGTLMELPLGWYAEKGGTWGMSPGYDTNRFIRAREINYECMFCHNGYPEIQTGSEEAVYLGQLPEGIDCQRCHGPGGRHVAAAQAAGAEQLRAAIVNPARLSAERQMDVCMQCHLQTTSSPLPSSILRMDRGPFSYRPGEPLEDFRLAFDKASTAGEDRFEIDSSAYRLRQSQCFLRSNGKLTCLTCHDPHNIPRGEEATRHYNGVCQRCHPSVAAPGHNAMADCVGCHMPKRRASDVVHVVMTDHWIQRRKPAGDLLAALPERNGDVYRGAVAPYYPAVAPALYVALAQVRDGSNLEAGLAQLTAIAEAEKPPSAALYTELGDAWFKTGNYAQAVAPYEEGVRLAPGNGPALRRLGLTLRNASQAARAVEVLNRAVAATPQDSKAWYELAMAKAALGQKADAVAKFRVSLGLDPDFAWAYNGLGAALADTGQPGPAEDAYRAALRLQPDLEEAMANLAALLGPKGQLAEALSLFERALSLKPGDAAARANYAVALSFMDRVADSRRQAELALKTDPNLPEMHDLLGGLARSEGRWDEAVREFSEAVRLQPDFARAQLNLGLALLRRGDNTAAAEHLRAAAASPEAESRQQALAALGRIGK